MAGRTDSRSERCKKFLSKSGGKKTRRVKGSRKRSTSKSRSRSADYICAKFSSHKGKPGQKGKIGGKCHKEGPVTRNPFLNFLRDYRKKHCGWSVVQIAREGAKQWRSMSEQQKQPYIASACKAPKKQRRCRSKRKSRSRSTCSSRSRKSSRSSSRCKSICKPFSGPC